MVEVSARLTNVVMREVMWTFMVCNRYHFIAQGVQIAIQRPIAIASGHRRGIM